MALLEMFIAFFVMCKRVPAVVTGCLQPFAGRFNKATKTAYFPFFYNQLIISELFSLKDDLTFP